MKIVDDVLTSMALTSFYNCNKKKQGTKYQEVYTFGAQHLYHCTEYTIGAHSRTA